MSPEKAKFIVEALANGTDPETGEVISGQNILNKPEIIRALFVAVSALQDLSKKKNQKDKFPVNKGRPWSENEERELLLAFDKGILINELVLKYGRSRGAIKSRLARLGRS